ncbi:MAG: hypothetical protein M3Y86_02740 [Verrucomicrobiota bacterium]|nr:hypothetical protein [Verrucomicrobiota bacterium]
MDDQLADTEDFAERGMRYTRDQFQQIVEQTEDYVRENPTRAIGYAVLAGLVIDRLPVFRIIGAVTRLSLMALKPAILVYGATKLYHAAQDQEV